MKQNNPNKNQKQEQIRLLAKNKEDVYAEATPVRRKSKFIKPKPRNFNFNPNLYTTNWSYNTQTTTPPST